MPHTGCLACVLGRSVVSYSFDPIDCSPPGFSVHGILRAKYWSGLPFPSPGCLKAKQFVYSIYLLEPRSLASGVFWAGLSLRSLGEDPSLPLLAPGGPRCPVDGGASLRPLPLSSGRLPGSLCLPISVFPQGPHSCCSEPTTLHCDLSSATDSCSQVLFGGTGGFIFVFFFFFLGRGGNTIKSVTGMLHLRWL